MNTIYVDNAATTKMRKSAVAAILPFLEGSYGNPSSLHSMGQAAANALDTARRDIAKCLGAKSGEIYFTSGGSEADNQAILTGAEYGLANGRIHIISQKTEHNAVLNTLKRLEKFGFEIELLDVDRKGRISTEQISAAIREDTALVSIMTANNEIGTIMPIKEISLVCRERGILLHTDAVQAIGHIPLDVHDIGCDMLSLSAHKFGGAKGVGALYVRNGVLPACMISGGGQERGVRSGTENVAGICSMAAALKEAVADIPRDTLHITEKKDKLINGLLEIPGTILNGDMRNRLPGNINVCFRGIEGEGLVLLLDSKGICASSGSACASGSLEPSHVLLAIGVPDEYIHGSLRLSLSADNTLEEIDYIIKTVRECVEHLRSVSPVWE